MMRIRVERTGAIRAHHTFARPEKKNALDLTSRAQAAGGASRSRRTRRCASWSLGAEGEDFCAGADLAALYATTRCRRGSAARDAEALGDVFPVLRGMPQVVIAAVRGRARSRAVRGSPPRAISCSPTRARASGIRRCAWASSPRWSLALLRRQIGEKRAFKLVATGRQVPAREALELFWARESRRPHTVGSRGGASGAAEKRSSPPCRPGAASPKRLFYAALDGMSVSPTGHRAGRTRQRGGAQQRRGVPRRRAPLRPAPGDMMEPSTS